MTLVPLRASNAYLGVGKQTAQGTAVAPSYFPRWLDGSSFEFDAKFEDIYEGDTTRRLSQIIKNGQQMKIKQVFYPRPNEVAFFEGAALGSGSDTYTAPTISTTTSGTNSAGATTLVTVGNGGLTGTGTSYVIVDAGTANEEIVALTTPGTGTGPYTYTIAAGGTLKFTHSAGATVQGAGNHVLTDQSDGNYYSLELSLGGASGLILRVRDCKVDQIKRSAKAGSGLTFEIDWVGCVTLVQVTPATVTLEAHPIFLFTQAVVTLDGVTTGDAPYLDSFDLTTKNTAKAIQTERLTPDAILFTELAVDLAFGIIFQATTTRIQLTYLGGTAGTTDAQAIGTGSLLITFTQANQCFTLSYDLPNLTYVKATIPQPKKDGEFVMAVDATSTSNQGAAAYVVQTTVNDSLYSAAA